jgi:hypothetical protein
MPTIEAVHARRERPQAGTPGRQARQVARHAAPPSGPVRTASEASLPQHPHTHVLIVADFVSTSEEFHRRLIWLARLLGTNISLIQIPTDMDSQAYDPTSAILLEGLRRRLGVPPEVCNIVPNRSIGAMTQSRYLKDADLVLLGRSHGHTRLPACDDLAAHLRAMGCEAIVIDDRPEWDWRP